ncbi:TetR/AcrR family transcriptional regulator [Pseudoalteromonas sp. L23]|uniref:TetR/AcrR family transcriptional regulator n=1 Tax=unclassified Pseudoalteromonas TaxID=194690 RepID=UPI001EF00388|nr:MULTISPECIES: TetR/AcrR family transcriptional regulator [unclassified Pseudoalteromonas]MCF7513207.1 TetR/AcrR family transcriptional regulator [Pseudoalteromonas sp. L7]MCF7525247.1 TetR/AcrR family transcriptional regulator [Pseudoalteromonas sp. L23]MCX2765673.1 TetR/AcrR family transcriptional regulator [Pseudoalteromonas sp. B530]
MTNKLTEAAVTPREKLITAGKCLFINRGYNRVTTRAIADLAEVNIALIKYYFGDKAGLFEAVFREVAAPLLSLLEGIKKSQLRELSPLILTQFIERYFQVMSQYPTLPKIIFMALHDTHSKEHEIIKKIFFEHVESGVSSLNSTFQTLSPAEPIRAEWLLLTCLGLSAFPFLVPPVMQPLLGIENSDTEQWRSLGKHQQAIFNVFLSQHIERKTS